MNRLTAVMRLDARLQSRNRVYLIVAVAAGTLSFALRGFFTPEQLHFFMPLVALSSVSATTFVLVGVLILLERAEGTLRIAMVSPLRPAEYLASKVMTVTMLSFVESLGIVVIAYGIAFFAPWLFLAVLLRAGFVAAVGVAIGVRYRSITQFLFPVAGLSIAFDLPVLWYLGLWSSPLVYLLPTMPSLLLAKAAFYPAEPMQLAYACIYGVLSICAALYWAHRSIDRFVVRGEIS